VFGGTLRVALPGALPALDPLDATDGPAAAVSCWLYDTLVVIDTRGEPAPGLATGWQFADDGLGLTLTLRADVSFHSWDGWPEGDDGGMDANDVRASLERVFERAGRAATVEVIAPDQLRIVSGRPDPDLVAALASPITSIVPAAAIEALEDGRVDVLPPVGTGPWRLAVTEREADGALRLERHAGAWHRDHAGRPLPYPDTLRLLPYASPQAALDAVLTGEADLALHLPQSLMTRVGTPDGAMALPRIAWPGIDTGLYLTRPGIGGLLDPDTGLMNPVRARLRLVWVE
jgi:ABC-type transport system substrate-binding protein